MRDDFLKEQLMGYARHGAEEALQPGAAEIRRRARRHYQRVAALTVTGVLLTAGLGLGIGLRHRTVPTVNQPPVTNPLPKVVPSTVHAGPPESFVTVVQGGEGADSSDLAVVATATGETIRSLAPATASAFTVSRDRAWVYFSSNSPSQGIYRVPFTGGPVEKVADTTESSRLAVSPDGSRLIWEVQSRNRPGFRIRDLARGTERALPIPGPVTGAGLITRGNWAWSPDSRAVAVLVTHGISHGYTELMTVDVVTGQWRHMFNFDARHGGGPDCCVEMDWPAGSRRIAFVQTVISSAGAPDAPLRRYQLMYVDPATGAAAPGTMLASGRELDIVHLDFDPSGRYVLFGLQSSTTVSTWWSGGGKRVRVNQLEIGSHVPAAVAGAYLGGAW
jgi:hypothetical protein